MAKYGVLILGGLVFLGAVAYAIFTPREEILPSSVSVETEKGTLGFKEYVNKELGFAILYPEGWSYAKATAGLSDGDYVAIVFNAPGLNGGVDEGVLPNIAVNYYKNLGVLL